MNRPKSFNDLLTDWTIGLHGWAQEVIAPVLMAIVQGMDEYVDSRARFVVRQMLEEQDQFLTKRDEEWPHDH